MWGQSWAGLFIFSPGENLKNQKTCVSSSGNTATGKYINLSCPCTSLTKTTPAPLFPWLRDAPAQWEECGITPGRAQHPPGMAVRVLRRQIHEEPDPGCAGTHEPHQVKSAHCIYPNFGDSFAFALPLLFAPSQLVFQDWQGLGGPRGKLGCSHTSGPPALM